MKVDRYTKVVLTVIAVALSALAFTAQVQGEGRYQLVMMHSQLSNDDISVVLDTRSGTLYGAPFHGFSYGALITLDARTGYGNE